MLFIWTSCKTPTSSNCIIWPGKAGLGLHDLWDIYNIPISSCGNIWQMAPVYDQQLYDIYISMIKQCQTNDHFLQHFNEKTIETIWFVKLYWRCTWQSIFNISYIYSTNVFDKIRKCQWRKYQLWEANITCLRVLVHVGEVVHVAVAQEGVGTDVEVGRSVEWGMGGQGRQVEGHQTVVIQSEIISY